jgi:DNA repair exonuclease SbcCD ATPase subunit
MKKVIFKTLKVKNFLSIGKTPVVINFQKGLNVITGINKDLMDRQNGTGKSSIVDSFYFALFGETTRELKKEFIINNVTNDTTEVSLQFSIDKNDYEIVRTIKPSKCYLFENGVDISRDSMSNTTEYLLSLLNLTPEIFSNCISLSINSTIPFMAQKKIDKRKFIEGIFNLDIFTKMNNVLKEDYKEIKKDIELISAKHSELSSSIKIIEEQNKLLKKERETRKNTILENIKNFESQIDKLEEKINEYEIKDNTETKTKIEKLEKKQLELKTESKTKIEQASEIKAEIKLLNENIKKIGTDKDECPVCLRPVTSDDQDHIDQKKKIIQERIEENENKLDITNCDLEGITKQEALVQKGISVLKDVLNKNILQNTQKKNDEDRLKTLKPQLDKERKALSELENIVEEESKNTDELNKKLLEYTNDLISKKQQFKVLDNAKFVLSEEGVKSYVVKKILNLFNSKIAFYLSELNSNAIITFDQYFEEEIKNERGKPTMYFNYSGAERKAIDLAVMFAFIDMLKMQTNVYYNVQFYDELLDTSLDSTGVENVVRLLKEFVEKQSYGIYVISHRKECSKLANGEVVFLEKMNGITKRISQVLEI